MRKHVSYIRTGEGAKLVIPYHPNNNLLPLFVSQKDQPRINIVHDIIKPKAADIFSSVVAETNQNLTPAQNELLVWHCKLSHIGFQWLQSLISSPHKQSKLDDDNLTKPKIILSKHPATKTCSDPLCAAFQLAQLTKKAPDIRQSSTPLPSSCMNLKNT